MWPLYSRFWCHLDLWLDASVSEERIVSIFRLEVNMYKTSWRHNPEDEDRYFNLHESLRSHLFSNLYELNFEANACLCS
jgi:hypothetical protein